MDPAPTCHYHDDQPELAECTRCGEVICHLCHGSDLRGFAVCASCRAEARRAATPWEDEASESSAAAFAQTTWDALRSPTRFWASFREEPRWMPATVYGVVMIAFGTALATVWEFLFNDEIEQVLRSVPGNEDLPSVVLRALSFARIPIVAPIVLGVHVGLLHAALRVAGVQPKWVTVSRIFGYACAGYALMILPPIYGFPLGHFLMIIWLFNIEVSGVRHFYPTLSPLRSMFVVLIPMMFALTLRCI